MSERKRRTRDHCQSRSSIELASPATVGSGFRSLARTIGELGSPQLRLANCVWLRKMAGMPLTQLIPMLPVKSVAAALPFYEKLGFTVERRQDDWGWAMLRGGAARLMLDESINVPGDAPRPGVLYLYPDDVVAFHEDVRDRGLEVPELSTTFYGMTEFRLTDPDGNRLWIGQPEKAAEKQ